MEAKEETKQEEGRSSSSKLSSIGSLSGIGGIKKIDKDSFTTRKDDIKEEPSVFGAS